MDPAYRSRFLFMSGDLVRDTTQGFVSSLNCPCLAKPFALQVLYQNLEPHLNNGNDGPSAFTKWWPPEASGERASPDESIGRTVPPGWKHDGLGRVAAHERRRALTLLQNVAAVYDRSKNTGISVT